MTVKSNLKNRKDNFIVRRCDLMIDDFRSFICHFSCASKMNYGR